MNVRCSVCKLYGGLRFGYGGAGAQHPPGGYSRAAWAAPAAPCARAIVMVRGVSLRRGWGAGHRPRRRTHDCPAVLPRGESGACKRGWGQSTSEQPLPPPRPAGRQKGEGAGPPACTHAIRFAAAVFVLENRTSSGCERQTAVGGTPSTLGDLSQRSARPRRTGGERVALSVELRGTAAPITSAAPRSATR